MTQRPDLPEKGHVGRSRKARIQELEKENAELRRLAGLDTPLDITTWEQVNSQEIRDALAVRALNQEWGDPYKALRRLGFDFGVTANGAIESGDRAEVRELIKRIFETEGVKALHKKAFEDIETLKPEIVNRQVQIAMYGDDESSVRAFSQVSKVAGWQKPDTGLLNAPTINLYNLVTPGGGNAPQVRAEVVSDQKSVGGGFLDHEPGEPVRIDSGDEKVYEALSE